MAEAIVIIGAGPAGVRAARTLAKAGHRPVLIDENLRIGGQIYRQPPPGAERAPDQLYGFEAAKAVAIHRALDGLDIDYRPETLVWNAREKALDLTGPRGSEHLTFDRLILATGATDRSIPFPGWTLPGVFSLGGAQIALKAQGCAIGRRVVFAGTGPLLPLVAYQYAKAGADVAAVLDTSSFATKLKAAPGLLALPKLFAKGLYYLAQLKRRGIPVIEGVDGFAVEGAAAPEAITWRRSGETGRIDCDAVGAGFGLRSETQLADLLGCSFAFDALTRQWLPTKDAAGRASEGHIYRTRRLDPAGLYRSGYLYRADRGAGPRSRPHRAFPPGDRGGLSVSPSLARRHPRHADRLPLRRRHRRPSEVPGRAARGQRDEPAEGL